MEIALTHSGPIPFDDYPDGSLFLCRMCNFEKNPKGNDFPLSPSPPMSQSSGHLIS